MTRKQLGILAGLSAVLLGAGVALYSHRTSEQADLGSGSVFSDFTPTVAEVNEIRLSKGDGSRTTLRKEGSGWMVVERQYPADASRVLASRSNLRGGDRAGVIGSSPAETSAAATGCGRIGHHLAC